MLEGRGLQRGARSLPSPSATRFRPAADRDLSVIFPAGRVSHRLSRTAEKSSEAKADKLSDLKNRLFREGRPDGAVR
jgi:hypothetical protein